MALRTSLFCRNINISWADQPMTIKWSVVSGVTQLQRAAATSQTLKTAAGTWTNRGWIGEAIWWENPDAVWSPQDNCLDWERVCVCCARIGFGFTMDPRRERASFHFSCLIRLSGPVVPRGPPALLSETLSWILMAWPEMHAIKPARPFLSVLSPDHCTEINES